MVITLVSPLESPNNGYVMPVTFLNAPLGLWFGYEVVRCWCSFLRLADWFEATCAWGGGGVGISCVTTYGALITSNMNSVTYFQLLLFLTFDLSPTWLIHYSGGRQRDAELASIGSNTFTLGMDKDSYIFTSDMPCWVGLLVPLVGWDSTSIGSQVKILQVSSGIGIVDEPVGLFLESELDLPLRYVLDSETGPSVGFQLIFDRPPGPKVR